MLDLNLTSSLIIRLYLYKVFVNTFSKFNDKNKKNRSSNYSENAIAYSLFSEYNKVNDMQLAFGY